MIRVLILSLCCALIGIGVEQPAVAVASAAGPAVDPFAGRTIHYAVGMIVTHTTQDAVNGGDGDSVATFQESSPDADVWKTQYVVTDPETKEVKKGFKEIYVLLRVFPKDVQSARRMICWTMPATDPDNFPGYTPCLLSREQFKDLKAQGSVPVNVGWINPRSSFGIGGELGALMQTRKHYRGVLSMVEAKPVMLSVLLNGKPRDIPTLHVRGRLSIGKEGGDADLWIQDDELSPLTIKVSFLESITQLTRVDMRIFPSDEGSLEQNLEKQCRVDIPGIFFATNSAQLLSSSNAALDDVAATLRHHPDWNVSVEGHTDNIGKDVANADLSTRRAATVRDALLARGAQAARIRSEGFGSKQPIASNDTLEGRARNRRVELRRKCQQE